ncbi:MAG: hypothetical protein ACRD0N_02010 [Acidimicrobiales bacterium]
MLARAGAGTALVWAAPAVTSLGRVHAAASPACTNCPGCSRIPGCGDRCFCVQVAGGCFCSANFRCRDAVRCPNGLDSDCPTGYRCQLGPGAGCCGENVCVPPCGGVTGVELGAALTNAG